MSAIAEITTANPRQSVGRAVVAATVGNMLEWYDFTIYAAFAVPISKTFFPADNEVVSLMLGLVTFGLGFVARPFGAAFLGGYADRRGRRDALSLTIMLMALGTGIIALCPGYNSIGIAAPIVILLARLIQGFSAGGEIGGAVSTLVEYAPPERRGLYASFQQLSQGGSTLLSGLVATTIALLLPADAILDWGWRLAFVVGLLIAPVGLYIRRELEDAPLFKASQHAKELPILVVLRDHWRAVLTGMLVVMLWTVAQYITNYFPTFAVRELKVSLSQSYLGPLVVGTVLLFCPVVGILADRFQRKRVMIVGALGLVVVAYPAFSYLIAAPSTQHLIATQIAVAVCMLIYTAPASAVLAELFPTAVRATGISLTYSLGVAIFGGFTPAIITALIGSTGQPISVAFYLMGAATISLITVLMLKDHTGEVLS
ncbi:MFS transporter [Afipia sp. GAS231]|uniref:MFS transporter n=1 Tax=Afipia sp. GAS231 TaxID=1882747 RepID=UPI00087C6477|nr:MFS transporter [Afipia sp. GAS231]SDO59144.1 MFS transporter, MHS family, proline/betaine transporter [Afipia sp. GAS231]